MSTEVGIYGGKVLESVPKTRLESHSTRAVLTKYRKTRLWYASARSVIEGPNRQTDITKLFFFSMFKQTKAMAATTHIVYKLSR